MDIDVDPCKAGKLLLLILFFLCVCVSVCVYVVEEEVKIEENFVQDFFVFHFEILKSSVKLSAISNEPEVLRNWISLTSAPPTSNKFFLDLLILYYKFFFFLKKYSQISDIFEI